MKLCPAIYSFPLRGLRRVRFHHLRHTFGSLLIQGGASLAYVKEQKGHSSIQVTVDIYGHLIPGANIAWVDRLDSRPSKQQTNKLQHRSNRIQGPQSKTRKYLKRLGRPPGIRTPIC